MESSDSDEDLQLLLLLDLSDDAADADNTVTGDAIEASYNHSNQTESYGYELLTTSDLISEMKNNVAKVSTVLGVSGVAAKYLLNKFEWNVELLLNNYSNSGNLDLLFQSLSIENLGSVISATEPTTECQICLTSLSETTVTNFQCGHQFCESCCCRYFEAKVLYDGEGNKIKCPDSHCKMLVGDEIVMKLIPENARHQLLTLISRGFVASNPLLRYCQSEGCDYTIKANKLEHISVMCKCGSESCLRCGEIWHDAITCSLLKKWIISCIDEVANCKWLRDNTQKCPKCKFNIEQNGGCNRMQCVFCGHIFCWICLGDWYLHTFCNRFELNEDNEDNATSRLIHYSSRYTNHIRSLKLERGIYDSIVRKVFLFTSEEMVDSTAPDVVFLKRVVESLRKSRQILIATYVFAYYEEYSNQLAIFEDNQHDLERATENLSWLLEQGVTEVRWVDVKQKLQEKYAYCDKRRRVLLDHINEGYKNGYWKSTDDQPETI